jgi:DNA-binding CsgD family transcriptional regulator
MMAAGVAMAVIFGRDAELSSLASFLEAIPSGPSALVLTGEPGIGKSTLWNAGLERARGHGYLVLTCRPSESEARLSFAALSDLLVRGYEDVQELPDLQRRALDVATLRTAPGETATDHRTVAAALLTVLRALSRSSPILIAIDDTQWLDRPSATAVEFVARRLSDEPIGILASSRIGEQGPDPLGLGRALPEPRLGHLRLEPLGAEATGSLIAERTGLRLPRPLINRVHEETRGNPLFALELARVIQQTGIPLAGEPIPAPPDLKDLLRARVAALPSSVHDVLLVLAALARPSVPLVEAAALDVRGVAGSLGRAVRAGLVEVAGDDIRFTHPLFASAVYADASARARRDVHRRIADVVADPEERARHLALTATEPDADVAAALEKAAALAAERGAPAAAAELLELALPLIPPERLDDRRRLQVTAADHRFLAGDQEAAVALLQAVVAASPDDAARADALVHLGRALLEEDLTVAASVLTEALALKEAPIRTRAAAAAYLGGVFLNLGDLEETERYASLELDLAERSGDASLIADALSAVAIVRAYLGRGIDYEGLRRAERLWDQGEFFSIDWSPTRAIGELMVLEDRHDEAREIFVDLLIAARERGDDPSADAALGFLTRIERDAGRWGEALQRGEERRALGVAWGGAVATDTLVRAHRGELETARESASRALVEAERFGHIGDIFETLGVLGAVELLMDNAEGALSYLRKAWEVLARAGAAEPTKGRFVPDLIEATILVGELDEAERLIAWLEERGRFLDRPRALATAARCRGQLLMARGDLEQSVTSLETALVEHDRFSDPFELGRTLLVLGGARRRTKQKRAAREALERALEIFEQLDARPWVDRTRAELASIGGRPAATGALTPMEERVAVLAAAGSTNREIADALFVSSRTVAGHLSHAYAKLGVRSRTELANALDAERVTTRQG